MVASLAVVGLVWLCASVPLAMVAGRWMCVGNRCSASDGAATNQAGRRDPAYARTVDHACADTVDDARMALAAP